MASLLSKTIPKLPKYPYFITSFSTITSPSPSTKPYIPTHEPSKAADTISQLVIQHHNPFHSMESSLQLHGISLSTSLLHQVLIRLSHNSKIALAFFTWVSQNPLSKNHIDVVCFNILIDVFGKVRQFDVVWQLILGVQSLGLDVGSDCFLIYIRRLVAAGLTRQAIRVFDDMTVLIDVVPSLDDFVYVLDTLCKYGYVRVAMEVFNRRKAGFDVDVRVYTVLICGWCKIKRVDMGEKLLREMVSNGIEANVVCYNVLLDGICRRASLHPDDRFERTIRAADRVFDEMRERGIEPDVTSYSIVLHVCSRAHKPNLSLDRLEMMKEKGICPSVVTYTSVVKCLCSCGRMEEAEKLIDEMVSNGVTPSAATYNCFYKEFKGRKDAEKALDLYRRMKGEGVCVPSLHTYHVLLRMFVKLNRMDVVEEIWNDLKENGAGPDLDSYTVLIHGLIEKQKWREACEYFVQMIERGLLPQKVTFETLYRGLIQADKLRTWRRLKKKLDEESISFGSEFEQYHLHPYKR